MFMETLKTILFSRLFLVHEDGSGTELLNSPAIDELLHQEHSDPNTVVLKEPLSEAEGALLRILNIITFMHVNGVDLITIVSLFDVVKFS